MRLHSPRLRSPLLHEVGGGGNFDGPGQHVGRIGAMLFVQRERRRQMAGHRPKEQPGKDIVVLGSGELIQSLLRADLVDEYVLLIHPLVLGSGRRMYREGSPYSALRLVDATATTTGVVIATYHRSESGTSR
jgi:RibD C-terminal domain